MESNGHDHLHEVDPDYHATSLNIRWTPAQTEIVMLGVKNEAAPQV